MVAHAKPPYVPREEYLRRERDAVEKSEYEDGTIVSMAGAQPEHNTIVFNLATVLGSQLSSGDCRGFSSDQRVRVEPTNRDYYPDLSIVCGTPEYEESMGLQALTNPTLIVEVLSPSTERRDRVQKFDSYRSIPRLTYYVLVSQDQPRIECFTRDHDGSWRVEVVVGLHETLRLASIGCQLPLAEVYARVVFPQEETASE